MSLISAMFLQGGFFSLKPALRLSLSPILLTGQVDALRCHFCATKIANQLMLFQFLAQMLDILAHLPNDGTGAFLHLSLHSILLRLEVGYQLPQDFVLKIVDLPCGEGLLHKVPIGLHLPRQLIQPQLRGNLNNKLLTLSGREVMYSMASYISLDFTKKRLILRYCSSLSHYILVNSKNLLPRSLIVSSYLWTRETSCVRIAILLPSWFLKRSRIPAYSDRISLSMMFFTNFIYSIRYSSRCNCAMILSRLSTRLDRIA